MTACWSNHEPRRRNLDSTEQPNDRKNNKDGGWLAVALVPAMSIRLGNLPGRTFVEHHECQRTNLGRVGDTLARVVEHGDSISAAAARVVLHAALGVRIRVPEK